MPELPASDVDAAVEFFPLAPGIVEVRSPGWTPPQPVMVSVNVETYQHGPFIDQCLKSICSQETDFAFEVLVGEDRSNDGTREVCLALARRYPDKIRLLLHDRSNVIRIHGMETGRFNGLTNIARGRGKYVAFCEGDDYWTDPRKLQKQVDFLEAHPEYALAFHDATRIDEQGRVLAPSVLGPKLRRHRTAERMVARDPMPTASIVARRALIERLPAGYREVVNADTYLISFLGQFGPGAYVDVAPSAYRVHRQGTWSQRRRAFKIASNLHTFQTLYRDIDPRYRGLIGYRICEKSNQYLLQLLASGDVSGAARHAARAAAYAARHFGGRTVVYELQWLAAVARRPIRRALRWIEGSAR